MRKFFTATLFIFMTMILSSCSSRDIEEPQETTTLQTLLTTANARRADIIKPDYNLLSAQTQGRIPETIDYSTLFDYVPLAETITSDEAIADVRLYFEVLRQLYGSYIYFGGDAVFLPVLDALVAELATRDIWTINDFERRVFSALNPIINDNHLTLMYNRFAPYNGVFTTALNTFSREGDNFYCLTTGMQVVDVVGHSHIQHDLEHIIRPSIDESGELLWSIVIPRVDFAGRGYFVNIYFEDGTSSRVWLHRPISHHIPYHGPTFEIIDGIPVVSIRRAYFETEAEYERLNTFLGFAEKLRDEPMFILDVRSNSGGNGTVPGRFFYELTGEFVPTNFAWMFRWDYAVHRELLTQPGNISYEATREFFVTRPFGEGHTIAHDAPRVLLENEQIVIVLTDRFTGSAGEMFVDMLLNMENTLIIGHNTMGSLHADTTYPSLHLPYSGLLFSIGRAIMLHPEGHNVEGIGIAPDVWVNGDALAAALALLNAY